MALSTHLTKAGPTRSEAQVQPAVQDCSSSVAKTHTRLGDLLDPSLDGSLIVTSGVVVVGGRIEAVGLPGLPDGHAPVDACSPCSKMNAFCAYAKFDTFIRFDPSPTQNNLMENSSFRRSNFQRAEHQKRRPGDEMCSSPRCADVRGPHNADPKSRWSSFCDLFYVDDRWRFTSATA